MFSANTMAKTGQNKREFDHVKYSPVVDGDYDTDEEGEKLEFSLTRTHDLDAVENGLTAGLEANGVHLEKAKILGPDDSTTVRVIKTGMLTRSGRTMCVLLALLVLLGGALFFVLVLPRLTAHHLGHAAAGGTATPDYITTLHGLSTESCVRLVDIDGDGRDDIIFGVMNETRVSNILGKTREQVTEYCHSIGEGDYCLGSVVAYRGYDGTFMWSLPTRGSVFELNCHHIDVNKDGRMDCIGSGRLSELVAFDPRDGTVFWRGDDTVLSPQWNVYTALVLPDLTGDGVGDVLISHGGDPKFPPEVHVRYPGRLVLLDGASGRSLGRFLPLTDEQGDKETYMSPVLHTTEDGSLYVLYGSGGETVPGSFYAISLPDLHHYVTSGPASPSPGPLPAGLFGPGKYGTWGGIQPDQDGVIQIYKSPVAGVSVPPVLVDMTGDGVRDILMLAYDGVTRLYNGETMEVIWSRDFSGYETYCTPAPGHFNDDDTLDFLLHLNWGTWDVGYNYSLAVVLDGSSGATLWQVNTTRYEMWSDLVARTTQDDRDVFITRVQGLNDQHHARMKRRMVPQQKKYPPPPDMNNSPIPGRGRQGSMGGGQPAYHYNTYSSHDDQYPPYDYSAQQQREEEGAGPAYYYPDNYDSDHHDTDTGFHGDTHSHDDTAHPHHESDEELIYMDPNYECESDPLDHTTLIFALDRSVWDQPITIYRAEPQKIYYNLTSSDRTLIKQLQEHISKDEAERKQAVDAAAGRAAGGGHGGRRRRHGPGMKGKKTHMEEGYEVIELEKPYEGVLCLLMTVVETSTGAIGDVDGDGDLDFVTLLSSKGDRHDEYGSIFDQINKVDLLRVSLPSALARGASLPLHPQRSAGAEAGGSVRPDIRGVSFRGAREQGWAGYMGTRGDSVYRT